MWWQYSLEYYSLTIIYDYAYYMVIVLVLDVSNTLLNTTLSVILSTMVTPSTPYIFHTSCIGFGILQVINLSTIFLVFVLSTYQVILDGKILPTTSLYAPDRNLSPGPPSP